MNILLAYIYIVIYRRTSILSWSAPLFQILTSLAAATDQQFVFLVNGKLGYHDSSQLSES